jgi:hypothetical protein
LGRLRLARCDFNAAFAPLQVYPSKPEQFLRAHARECLERDTGRGLRPRRM